MQIHYLWPTSLWESYQDTTLALEVAKSLLPDENTLKNWTDVRPWCSEDLLHEQDEWTFARDIILEEAVQYADNQQILYQNLYITSMWVNAQYQRQNHVAHTHPNSLFSGIWYLDTPPGSQCFTMYDPRPASAVISPRTKNLQGNISVPARAGTILIWPSWVMHGTQSITPDELERPRISLAFNVMLRDSITRHSARIDYL